jgi:hypothetical protein
MPQPLKNAAAVALGRLGGSANTKAQNAARKANAKFAGRPGRVCVKCRQPVKGGHKDPSLDDTCGAHAWTWERAGVIEPPRPDPARQLLREALELLTTDDSPLNLRDWTRAARKLLKK